MGPSAFRIAGLGERLAASATRRDCGDLPLRSLKRTTCATSASDTSRHRDASARALQIALEVARRRSPADRTGRRPQPRRWVGGGRGTGRERGGRPIGLIWVDAHGDMNTPASSMSATSTGCRSQRCSAPSHRNSPARGFAPKIEPAQTVLIGVRNLDEREKAGARVAEHVFTMNDIDRAGISAVIERAIRARRTRHHRHSVSFDLDVCDPAIAPGVGTPVKGGLDYREAHMVMEVLADSGRLVALDMVEVNPRSMFATVPPSLARS